MVNLAGPQSDGKLSEDPVTTAPGGVPSHYYIYVRTQDTTGGGVGVKSKDSGANQNLKPNREDVQGVVAEGQLTNGEGE